MMQFVRDKDLYRVARITGPSHNLLGVRLSQTDCATQVIALPVKPGYLERLDGHEVLSQVLEGLNEVNNLLGKSYPLSEVQYVPSDTKPTTIYAYLIQELIKRIDQGGAFVES